MAIDTTRPSVSRIYDYMLGGHHNFDADRAAAEKILAIFPSYPTWARLNRWFLQMIAARWAEEGHTAVLDVGSGLPTEGHFHNALPQARVLYTDNDPMTVAYATEVLDNNTMVSFRLADARDPAEILSAANQFLPVRKVAVGCIGVSYFLDDTSLRNLMQALHQWAAPGSVLAISYIYAEPNNPRAAELLKNYQRYSGAQVFLRSPDDIAHICAPWKVSENQPLAELLGVEQTLGEAEREGMGADMFGALLEHAN